MHSEKENSKLPYAGRWPSMVGVEPGSTPPSTPSTPEPLTTAPLHLSGCATDHIWLMEDGPESHPIGVRVDDGDSGTLYLSREQAKELGGELIRFAVPPNATGPLNPLDLVYVSEIERSQDERVESFCTVLRDMSKLSKIGHAITLFECETDGKARVGFIVNTELAEVRGKTGLLRAEELCWLLLGILGRSGMPKMPVGAAEGLEWCRENLWKESETK